MLKEIGDYLVASLGSLTLGTTLQIGFRPPDAPDACSTLQERSGALPDEDNSKYWQKPMQVLTRAPGYHDAEAECQRIFQFLRDLRQVSMSGFHVYTVTGVSPQYLGPDSQGRHEFSANLILRLRKEG